MRRRVWKWNRELDVPNGVLMRDPLFFYLRLRYLRISFGREAKTQFQIGRNI